MRKTFRASLIDGPRRIMRDAELAQRKLIASFHGRAFTAERNGEDLEIFLVSSDLVSTQTLGDRATVMTAARLQAQIVAGRERAAAADAMVALEKVGRR
jgi:hypothetical protein